MTILLNGTTGITSDGTLTLPDGTANGVPYLNGSKVLTSGTALTFDGATLSNTVGGISGKNAFELSGSINATKTIYLSNYADAANNWNYIRSDSGLLSIFATGSNSLVFGASGSEQMRLTSTGLGIGTSSPGAKLDVYAGSGVNTYSRISSSAGQEAGLQFADGGTLKWTIYKQGGNSLGIYNHAGSAIAATLDSSGNLGLGVTPSAWNTNYKAIQNGQSGWMSRAGGSDFYLFANSYQEASSPFAFKYINTAPASRYQQDAGAHAWFTAPSGTAGNAISFTQAMTLDSNGALLLGTTNLITGFGAAKITIKAAAGASGFLAQSQTSGFECGGFWNTDTSANNVFVLFGTEATYAGRGSITYNRAGGLTSYNTTSDYRAKDIIGPVIDSGALIDSVPVYMGKMKGATQERPMFIAHETPSYAHTGEKDAVDADGKPVYQQMDASSLVPVLWAEIQSMRKRLASLEGN